MKEGATVYHASYGFGVVTKVTPDWITVRWDSRGYEFGVPARSLKLAWKDES